MVKVNALRIATSQMLSIVVVMKTITAKIARNIVRISNISIRRFKAEKLFL